jgi:Monomeric isocitrate dehydrogenase
MLSSTRMLPRAVSSLRTQPLAFVSTTKQIVLPHPSSCATTRAPTSSVSAYACLSAAGMSSSHDVLRLFSTKLEIPPPPSSNHPHKSLTSAKGSLIYTETDEAPALATYSLLPILTKVRILYV